MAADEKTLRQTKDNLVGAITGQAKQFGLMPDVEAAEKFLDPILRKVEADAAAPKPAKRPVPERPEDSQWYGEPGHSPKVPIGTTIVHESLGTFDWNLQTNNVSVPSHILPREPRLSPSMRAARDILRVMRNMPEWRAAIEKVALSSAPPAQKERTYRDILNRFRRFHGDPRKGIDPKIVVGGKR